MVDDLHKSAFKDSLCESNVSWSKHIAILLPMTWSIRNVVTSGLVQRLLAGGARVTLLPLRTNRLDSILPGVRGVAVEPLLEPIRRTEVRASHILRCIANAAFHRRHRIHDQWRVLRKSRQLQGSTPDFRNFLTEAIGCGFQPRFLYKYLAQFNGRIYRRENDLTQVYQQLRDLKPDLLCSTVCVDGRERAYVCAAKDLGIRMVASILSFDNLTSRAEIPTFDHYTVWNQKMKARLVGMYPEVDPKQVFITGTPQFDFHRRSEFRWTREETLRRLGLSPGARYLLYTGNHYAWTPTEPDLVSAFAKKLAQSDDLRDLWIVVRLHPLDDLTRWQRLERSHKVVICPPWLTPPDETGWAVLGPDDQRLLVSSFAHCELCVNMCSTTALDAAVFNRPVIGIMFASQASSVETEIYREAYRSQHYRPLVETGGLRLAGNWAELLALVRQGIRCPTGDELERQTMVEQECGVVDGHATERIAEVMLGLLNR